MKKNILFILLMAFSLAIFAQEKKPVAVNDTVYVEFGGTYTVYPLLNDFDPEGEEFSVDYFNIPYQVSVLNTTDTSITFKVLDYLIAEDWNFKISYVLKEEIFNPDGRADIRVIINMHSDILVANDVKATIFPQNLQFADVYTASFDLGFFYPADAPTSSLFNYGLWIGGEDENEELHLAAEKYKQIGSDFWSGPLSVDGLATTDSLNSGNWFRTWKVTKRQILTHIASYQDPTYEMPEAILNWPAHGDADLNQAEYLAPFADVDGDLEYHPELGDYPFIKGDEAIFFIYNDQLQHGSEGSPMGVEIHCMAWAFESVKDIAAYESTMFFSYKIFNRSEHTYYNTYLGTFADMDIGNYQDDYLGCHVANGNFYGYNGDDFDEDANGYSGYGANTPTQSVCILGGPFMDDDGIDNPMDECNESINGAGFGDGTVDNERYGMNRFVYFDQTAVDLFDPSNAVEYYKIMQGIWKDDTPLVYGGNGHESSGGTLPTRFMFPGDSDACHWGTNGVEMDEWSEETAENVPSDRKGFASMGPFTFEAGSVHYLDIAMVTAPGDAGKSSKDLVQDYVSQIKQDYLVNPETFGNQYVGIEDHKLMPERLLVYPNPVDGNFIRFELDDAQASKYAIYSAAGQLIESGQLNNNKQQRINVGHLQSGWYILEVKTADRVLRTKLIL